jgi:hypothetical protein
MESKMPLETSTLRPGLLVSLKTTVKGNVSYHKETIEEDHLTDSGAKMAKWETERKIADPIEHERAQEARSKASHVIRRVCSATAFGLLCPEDKADELAAAIAEARGVADAFNASASITNLGVYVVCGRVSQNDVEAVRAINSEVRELMDAMQDGLRNMDVQTVRAAAQKAKSLGQMLSADASEKIQVAIEVARKAAREIVKAGETGAAEIDTATIRKIAEQRTAFLDLDAAGEVIRPAETARALDFEPEEASEPVAPVATVAGPAVELGEEEPEPSEEEVGSVVRDAALEQYADGLRKLGVNEDDIARAKAQAVKENSDAPMLALAKANPLFRAFAR